MRVSAPGYHQDQEKFNSVYGVGIMTFRKTKLLDKVIETHHLNSQVLAFVKIDSWDIRFHPADFKGGLLDGA